MVHCIKCIYMYTFSSHTPYTVYGCMLVDTMTGLCTLYMYEFCARACHQNLKVLALLEQAFIACSLTLPHAVLHYHSTVFTAPLTSVCPGLSPGAAPRRWAELPDPCTPYPPVLADLLQLGGCEGSKGVRGYRMCREKLP